MDKLEIQKLAIYCQCRICTSKWYELSAYFKSAECIGCLKSDSPSPYYIDLTKQYIKDNNIKI